MKIDLTYDMKKFSKKEIAVLNHFPKCALDCPAIVIHRQTINTLEAVINRLNKSNKELESEIEVLKQAQTQNKRADGNKQDECLRKYERENKRLKTTLNEAQKDNDILRKNIVEIANTKKYCKKNRTHKYNAKSVIIDGIKFDSIKESKRYIQLKFLKRSKKIRSFDIKPAFVLSDGKKKIKYIADFRVIYPDGKIEIEDVKGFKTPVYNLKKNLMKNCYNIDIKEI